jgi:hypothetical protein
MTWKTLEEELPKVGDYIIFIYEDEYDNTREPNVNIVFGVVSNSFLYLKVEFKSNHNGLGSITLQLQNSEIPYKNSKWRKIDITEKELEEVYESIVHTRE